MKLTEITDKIEKEISNIINRPIPMSLIGPENCLITLHTKPIRLPNGNHRLNALYQFSIKNDSTLYLFVHVDLFIDDSLTLRKKMFDEILMGTVYHLRQRNLFTIIPSNNVIIILNEIEIYQNKLRINLGNFLLPDTLNSMITPNSAFRIEEHDGDLIQMSDNDLPTIDLDYNKEYVRQEQRAKNVYKAFRKGKIENISYVLPEDYVMDINFDHLKFDPEEKYIKPHFRIIITIWLDEIEYPTDLDDKPQLQFSIPHRIQAKFTFFDIILRIN